MTSAPIKQPSFDPRITTLTFPLGTAQFGTLRRGFMVWDQAISGYSGKAQVNFLYNPSTVTADYAMSDSSVGPALLFPTGFDQTNLRVPLNQVVTWSLLFDRTYELWGGYNASGLPISTAIGPNGNDPALVGVLADIRAMQQFTGMNVAYSTGNTKTTKPASTTLQGWQGVMQLIPSWVYFGDANNLWYHGYISEWSVTVTHWTQYMVPMRCVIDLTFTMLPPPATGSGSQVGPNTGETLPKGQFGPVPKKGISGR